MEVVEKCPDCNEALDSRRVDSPEEEIEEIRFYGDIPIVMGWNPLKQAIYFDSYRGNEAFTMAQCGRVLIVGALNHRYSIKRSFSQVSMIDIKTGECSNTTNNRIHDSDYLLSLDLTQIEYPVHSHYSAHISCRCLEYLRRQDIILSHNGLGLFHCYQNPALQRRRNIAINNQVLSPGQIDELNCPVLVEFRENYQNASDYLKKWGQISEAEMVMSFKKKLVDAPQLLRRNQWAYQIKNDLPPPIITGNSAMVKICNRSFSPCNFNIDGQIKEAQPYGRLTGKVTI